MAAPVQSMKKNPTQTVTSSAALTAAIVAATQGSWVATAVLAGIAVLCPVVTLIDRKVSG